MSRAYYNDNNPYAAKWLRKLISLGLIAPGDVDERSILDVDAHELKKYTQVHLFAGIGGWSLALRIAGWEDDRKVWTASCPCQPLSSAGKRKGHADRRHLWPAVFDLIEKCGPSVVFGEQVASNDGREWFAGIRADLETLGHACGAADLSSAGEGSPHSRQRIYWVADADSPGERGKYPQEGYSPQENGGPWKGFRLVSGRGSGWDRGEYRRGPTEPFPFVLDDGFPGRVGQVSGFGNSIVPQTAAKFITAFRSAKGEFFNVGI